jgi:hypothetical protein
LRNHDDSASRKATQAAKKAADPNTIKEVQKELATQVDTDVELTSPGRSHVHRPSALVSKSHIAHTRLGSSASTKLNFIINEVKFNLDCKYWSDFCVFRF